jgi:hypothetical protein
MPIEFFLKKNKVNTLKCLESLISHKTMITQTHYHIY